MVFTNLPSSQIVKLVRSHLVLQEYSELTNYTPRKFRSPSFNDHSSRESSSWCAEFAFCHVSILIVWDRQLYVSSLISAYWGCVFILRVLGSFIFTSLLSISQHSTLDRSGRHGFNRNWPEAPVRLHGVFARLDLFTFIAVSRSFHVLFSGDSKCQ